MIGKLFGQAALFVGDPVFFVVIIVGRRLVGHCGRRDWRQQFDQTEMRLLAIMVVNKVGDPEILAAGCIDNRIHKIENGCGRTKAP